MDEKTLAEFLGDTTIWDASDIADALGVQIGAVRKWRNQYLKDLREGRAPGTGALPAPDIPGKPLWHAGTIRRWAMQTGRMDRKGNPQQAKSPGRPRGVRNKAKAAA